MGIKRKRSGLEDRVADLLEPAGFSYEKLELNYMVPRTYKPDFHYGDTIIEVKGWFRPGDTQKYKAIHDSLPDYQLVFILQAPDKKVRKGSNITMAQWCEKHDIPWYSEDELLDLIEDIVIGDEDETC